MSSLELSTLRQFNGLGESETPDVKQLPWDLLRAPDPKAQARAARMTKLSEFGAILGVVGGTLGLFLTLKALGLIGKKK